VVDVVGWAAVGDGAAGKLAMVVGVMGMVVVARVVVQSRRLQSQSHSPLQSQLRHLMSLKPPGLQHRQCRSLHPATRAQPDHQADGGMLVETREVAVVMAGGAEAGVTEGARAGL